MKTKFQHEKGRICLVVDEPKVPRRQRIRLASMDQYEGTRCWTLFDVRLAQHQRPSEYSGASGEDYCASYVPDADEESRFVQSLLRECTVCEDGMLLWCTFEGLPRGVPTVDGSQIVTWRNFNQVGYFSKSEALDMMKSIQLFWNAYEGDPASAKIENIHRQPTLSQVTWAVSMHRQGR